MTIDIDELLSKGVPVPEKGETLFSSEEDWRHNACLNWCHAPWELYTVGYKDAADLLVQSISEKKGTADSLVYPVLFLYRQYLELRMKDLIKEGRALYDIEQTSKPEHRLHVLWPQVKEIIVKAFPEGDKNQLEAMDELIKQFSDVDPGSMAFRYPINNDGKPFLEGITHINLRKVSETIEKMATVLEGSSAGISEYLQFKYEMQSEGY